VLPMHCL